MAEQELIANAELAVESWARLVTAAREDLARAEAQLGAAVDAAHRRRKTLARHEQRYEEAQRNLQRALELL